MADGCPAPGGEVLLGVPPGTLPADADADSSSMCKKACSQCGKVFARQSDLNSHQRRCHQGEKPFVCGTCNARFGTPHVPGGGREGSEGRQRREREREAGREMREEMRSREKQLFSSSSFLSLSLRSRPPATPHVSSLTE